VRISAMSSVTPLAGLEFRGRRSAHVSSNHGTKHSTKRTARTTYQTVRVTLAVHPWFGHELVILGPRGSSIRGELPDGRTCDMPLAWTDWRPRPAALALGGKPVRLEPAALMSLAAWVADRRKLDHADREDQKRPNGGESARSDATASAVVGKAGAPRSRRSNRRPQRGPR
jgi:hypothetical protein